MINEKMEALGSEPSEIRKLFEEAKLMRKERGEDNVFDFSIGNPSAPSPIEVKEGLIKLIQEEDPHKLHSYTSSQGDPETRKAIAEYLNKKYDANANPDLIYLTMGASAGLAVVINALTNPCDEIIVFAPYFPEYRVISEKAGAKFIEVKTNEKFMPDIALLDEKVSEKTKCVIIDSPNNPTGVVYPETLIKSLADYLKKKEKEYNHPIYLFSDEPYRELIYNDTEYPFITRYYDDSIITYSFSKSLSIPGERFGYVLVSSKAQDKDRIYKAICGAGRALGYVCAVTLFQKLIPHVLGITSDLSIYRRNRDLLCEMLEGIGYGFTESNGAFYLFLKALEDDEKHFSEVAKEYGLFLVPSQSFGIKGYVRVSYCVKEETIKNSRKAFEALFKRYRG
jgi:aspartate aminotransferase